MITSCANQTVTDPQDKRGLNWSGPNKNTKEPYISGDYRALIIGNNQYQDKNGVWRELNTAVSDAQSLASLLKSDYGFSDVTVVTNANRKKILGEFELLSKRVNPNDNILIYYAGHGHLEDNSRRGYWIPVDGQGYDSTTFIRNSTIRDEINIIAEKTKHTLLISDSCFSGALLRGGNRGPNQFQLNAGYYKKVASKKSVQVFTAGGNEFVDDNYRDSGHSPFTYFLINELKNNTNKMLSLSEIATNVIKAVANNVDQTPAAGVLQGAGDELGEFIFARVSIKDNVVEVIAARNVPMKKHFDSTEESEKIMETPVQSDQSQARPHMPFLRF